MSKCAVPGNLTLDTSLAKQVCKQLQHASLCLPPHVHPVKVLDRLQEDASKTMGTQLYDISWHKNELRLLKSLSDNYTYCFF